MIAGQTECSADNLSQISSGKFSTLEEQTSIEVNRMNIRELGAINMEIGPLVDKRSARLLKSMSLTIGSSLLALSADWLIKQSGYNPNMTAQDYALLMTPAAFSAITTMGIARYNSTGKRKEEAVKCNAVRRKLDSHYAEGHLD